MPFIIHTPPYRESHTGVSPGRIMAAVGDRRRARSPEGRSGAFSAGLTQRDSRHGTSTSIVRCSRSSPTAAARRLRPCGETRSRQPISAERIPRGARLLRGRGGRGVVAMLRALPRWRDSPRRTDFVGPEDCVLANRLGHRLDGSALRRRYSEHVLRLNFDPSACTAFATQPEACSPRPLTRCSSEISSAARSSRRPTDTSARSAGPKSWNGSTAPLRRRRC